MKRFIHVIWALTLLATAHATGRESKQTVALVGNTSIDCYFFVFQPGDPWKFVQWQELEPNEEEADYLKVLAANKSIPLPAAGVLRQLSSLRCKQFLLTEGQEYVVQVFLTGFRANSWFWSQKVKAGTLGEPLIVALPECLELGFTLRGFTQHPWYTEKKKWYLSLIGDLPSTVNHSIIDIGRDVALSDGVLVRLPSFPIFAGSYKLWLWAEPSHLAISLGSVVVANNRITLNGEKIPNRLILEVAPKAEMRSMRMPILPTWTQ